ncbi:MAG: TolC family protein [Saprospiraceae bacterium]
MYKLLFFLYCTNSFAQDALSLSEVFQIALKNNYGIKLLNKDLDIAKLKNSWTSAEAYPEISLNIDPNIISNSVDQKFVNNTQIKRDNAVQSNLSASVQLNYNVLNGFKVFVTKEKLNQLELLSANDLELEILNTYTNVANIYYQIKSLQNSVPTLKAQEKIALERKDLEEKKYLLGQYGKLSFLQASLDYQDIKIVLLKQDQEIKELYYSLNKLIQLDVNSTYRLSDSLDIQSIKTFSMLDFNLDSSIHDKKFQLREKVQKLIHEELKRQKYPNLSVLMDYHFNRSDNQAGFNLYNQSYGPGVGLQFSMPLYNGSRTNKELAINSLEISKIDLEQEQWDHEANYLFLEEKSKIQHFINIYELENAKVSWANENLDIIRKKTSIEETSALEFSQALYQIVRINSSLNDALFNAKLAEINTFYLMGRIDLILKD